MILEKTNYKISFGDFRDWFYKEENKFGKTTNVIFAFYINRRFIDEFDILDFPDFEKVSFKFDVEVTLLVEEEDRIETYNIGYKIYKRIPNDCILPLVEYNEFCINPTRYVDSGDSVTLRFNLNSNM